MHAFCLFPGGQWGSLSIPNDCSITSGPIFDQEQTGNSTCVKERAASRARIALQYEPLPIDEDVVQAFFAPFRKVWPEEHPADIALEGHPMATRETPLRTSADMQRRDNIRKKSGRIIIPHERTIQTIDEMIEGATDEDLLKELRQQKRLLRNREAALASRHCKQKHTEDLEHRERSFHANVELGEHMFPTSARPRHTQPLPKLSGRVNASADTEPAIDCFLNGQPASPFPDTGACANFLSKSYVVKNQIRIDHTSTQTFKNGVGRSITTLGSVVLPFHFKGEAETHFLDFHVTPRAVRDVVLGGPFLRLTQTFSRFKNRVIRKLRTVSMPRLWYFGDAEERVCGLMNGVLLDALADTGSDINVMSRIYAKSRGFVIHDAKRHRIPVVLADDSIVMTCGMVKNVEWQFGSSLSETHYSRFYVLDDLACEVILGYNFLDGVDAFSQYHDSFLDISDELDEAKLFLTLTRAPDLFAKIKSRFKGQKQSTEQDPVDAHQIARQRLLQVKDDNVERIRRMAFDQQAQATAGFRSWWKPEWDALHASSSGSSASI